MTPDRDNPILDACLEEILADRTPPDLTARILQAWAARGASPKSSSSAGLTNAAGLTSAAGMSSMVAASLSASGQPIAPPLVAPPVSVPAMAIAPSTVSQPEAIAAPDQVAPAIRTTRVRSRKTSYVPVLTLSAAIALVAVGVAWWGLSQPSENSVAGGGNKSGTEKLGGEKSAVVKSGDKSRPQRSTNQPQLANSPSDSSTKNSSNGPDRSSNPGRMNPGTVDNGPPQIASANPAQQSETLENPTFVPPPAASPSSLGEVISFVNTTVDAAWKANRVEPSPTATEAEYCRRVFLRLLGRIPTVKELETHLADKSPNKSAALVDRLLAAEEYRDEYSRYWATIFATALIGRSTGSDDEGPASREGLELYLRDAIAKNKSYDKIAFELITAEGTGEPGSEKFNGAVNFMLDSLDGDGTLATARVSRVFLGHQLQCAQCHHHPAHDFTQQQYWSMNAFFRQARLTKIGGRPAVVDADFVSSSGNTDEAEVYYQAPNGLLKAAYPEYLDGSKVDPSGLVSEVRRRAELARLVVTSKQFSRATVNRVWSHFFGYGFTRPIDDMVPLADKPVAKSQPQAALPNSLDPANIRLADSEAEQAEIIAAASGTHPELLERLSDEFIRSGHDLKMLIRWITLSDPFQRSSKITASNLVDAPEAGTVPLFSHYYARQMQAEEVYQSLLIAAQLRKSSGGQSQVELARRDWLAQFQRNMATDDAEEETNFNGSMSQSLAMMNGELMQRAVSSRDEGLLRSVVESKMSPQEKVEHLFLAALSRRPSKRELEAAEKMLASAGPNPAAAVEDIWWALLNSNEFILDH
ncbi:protein of unknown function DUF1549 [Pirellula staleyi DSM 6068]|uniref:Cytochrome c domain-containing protein n=1 Tax=Pirellula staleyi (strain ATCC 27377 / DSM 6068 / ICPB 4128) TaxID=530564 RepID=D2R042_PIRSD|nr:DUF1549 domain-containing protein [Pirellula staleyi]ADB18407.1 protein of unknown function DUF1549 [Pirellula staleyi DSM 6068]